MGRPPGPFHRRHLERAITTGSVSKALGLQGLRTGWMICRSPEVILDCVILRENSSEIMNILGEVIAEIALRPDRYGPATARARDEGRANLDKLDRFVADQPQMSWVRPQAGLIGLARLGGGVQLGQATGHQGTTSSIS